jgi:hypothetical protein
MARISGEMRKDRLHFRRDLAVGLVEPALEQRQIRLVAHLEIGRDQIVLAAEVVIQRALGEAGFLGHRIDAHRADSLTVEQLAGGRDDALAGAGRCGGHGFMYTNQ